MEELQQGNPQDQHMHVRHVGWMYVALVAIAFAAVIGTGFGVYYLQQGQVESLEKALGEKNEIKVASSKEITSTTTTLPFAEAQIPYTLSYPADWVKEYDTPIHRSSQPPYTVSFKAPGTVIVGDTASTRSVKNGALVMVRVETSPAATPDEFIKSSDPTMKLGDRRNVTVAGIASVEFRAPHEGQEAVYTVFVKDNKAYQYIFVTGEDLQKSKYLPVYKDLLASVKFK